MQDFCLFQIFCCLTFNCILFKLNADLYFFGWLDFLACLVYKFHIKGCKGIRAVSFFLDLSAQCLMFFASVLDLFCFQLYFFFKRTRRYRQGKYSGICINRVDRIIHTAGKPQLRSGRHECCSRRIFKKNALICLTLQALCSAFYIDFRLRIRLAVCIRFFLRCLIFRPHLARRRRCRCQEHLKMIRSRYLRHIPCFAACRIILFLF